MARKTRETSLDQLTFDELKQVVYSKHPRGEADRVWQEYLGVVQGAMRIGMAGSELDNPSYHALDWLVPLQQRAQELPSWMRKSCPLIFREIDESVEYCERTQKELDFYAKRIVQAVL